MCVGMPPIRRRSLANLHYTACSVVERRLLLLRFTACERKEVSVGNEPAVYCTVRLGYFRCSHGTNTRPSALVFTGKSMSGSWSRELGRTGWGKVEGTYKVLKLLDHPGKPFGSHTDIVFVETGALIYNARLAVSYLDDVYVRQSPSLCGNVSQGSNLRDEGFGTYHIRTSPKFFS